MSHLSQEKYDEVYGLVPRTCVDLVVRNSAGGVLLLRRSINPYKDIWCLPGGGVKFKESPEAAVRRIAGRELGSQVKIKKLLGYCDITNDDLSPEKPRHSISLVFEVELLGELEINGENSAAEFFRELPKDVHPYHRDFILEKVLAE